MNKIYKIIWSRTKNCYVVASELAKSHTKSTTTSCMSGLKGSVLTAAVLTAMATTALGIQSVNAEAVIVENALGMAISNTTAATHAVAEGHQAIAIGEGSVSNGADSIAIGTSAKAEPLAENHVSQESIAIGKEATTTMLRAIALGYKAQGTGNWGISIGSESEASGPRSMAVGQEAKAKG